MKLCRARQTIVRNKRRCLPWIALVGITSVLSACDAAPEEPCCPFGVGAAVVEGRVTTAASGIPVAGADVALTMRFLRAGDCGAELVLGGDTNVTTDEVGEYEAPVGVLGISPIACVEVAVTPPPSSGLKDGTAQGIVDFGSEGEEEPGVVRIDVVLQTAP